MENKENAPYGPRPTYPTPRLNCLIKRPDTTPIVCAKCGVSLAGKLLQSTCAAIAGLHLFAPSVVDGY